MKKFLRKEGLISLGLLFMLLGCSYPYQHYRRDYLNANPQLSEEVVRGIIAGNVWVGMTEHQLFASQGMPRKTTYSTYTTWYYFKVGIYTWMCVVVENNKVNNWVIYSE